MDDRKCWGDSAIAYSLLLDEEAGGVDELLLLSLLEAGFSVAGPAELLSLDLEPLSAEAFIDPLLLA